MYSDEQNLDGQIDLVIDGQRLLCTTQKTTFSCDIGQHGVVGISSRVILNGEWECKVGDGIGGDELAGKKTASHSNVWTGRVVGLIRKTNPSISSFFPPHPKHCDRKLLTVAFMLDSVALSMLGLLIPIFNPTLMFHRVPFTENSAKPDGLSVIPLKSKVGTLN